MQEFNGFNKDIYKFFSDLLVNNNKVWFDTNREFYEKNIKNTSKIFIESMKEAFHLAKLDYIADPKFNLFRINRDIRFSQNKNPYKTNLGIFFPHNINVNDIKKIASGVYIHYGIDECFVATGMHNPSPQLLKLIRKKISDNWYDFESIIENKEFKDSFPKIDNQDKLSKKVVGYSTDNPAYEFLKKKTFVYYKTLPHNIFYSKEIIDITLKSARSSREFSIFLNDVLLDL